MPSNKHNKYFSRLAGLVIGAVLLVQVAHVEASTWAPTFFVNTEAFQVIDEGDSATDVYVQFGDSLNKKLTYERSATRFMFDDDLHVDGNFTVNGSLSGASLTISNLQNCDTIDTDASGNLVCGTDDGGGGGGLSFDDAASYFVNEAGDTMTGALAITVTGGDNNTVSFETPHTASGRHVHAQDILTSSGDIVASDNITINSDGQSVDSVLNFMHGFDTHSLRFDDGDEWFEFDTDTHVVGTITATQNIHANGNMALNADIGATDVTLTFGSDGISETLRFYNDEDRFEFSDDVHATGNLTASGTLTVDGASVFGSTVTLNGVTYTFPYGDGTASGKFLATNGAGQLVWTDATSSNDYITFAEADSWFVNESGDTMTGTLTIDMPGATGTGLVLSGAAIINSAGSPDHDFIVRGGTEDKLLLVDSATDRIGIQNPDPQAMLHVGDGDDSPLGGNTRFFVTSPSDVSMGLRNTNSNIELTLGTAGGDAHVGTMTSDKLKFLVSGTIRTALDASGRFGIGTESPTTKLEVVGSMSGASLAVSNLQNCDTIDTDASGIFTCGTDDAGSSGLTFAEASSYFVDDAGDTMTGALIISNTLDTTGDITTDSNLTINEDNGAVDAVFTFGSDGTAETLSFLNAEDRFEFSDDIHATGNITASGSLTVDGAAVFGSTMSLNGVTYTFPYGDGTASGKTLKTSGAGQLVWSDDDDVPESGDFGAAGDLDADGTITDGVIDKADLSVSTDFGDVSTDGSSNLLLDANVVDSAEITDDAVQLAELDDDSNTPTAGDILVVETGDNSVDYLTPPAGDLVGTTATQTVTNKTINVNDNTLQTLTGALMWYIDGDIATGTEQSATLTLPFAMTVVDIELHVKTAPTGSSLIVDVNEGGTTIFSTNPEIDAAATTEDGNQVISDTSLAKGSEISVDVDQIGSTVAGNGLTIQLIVTYDM